LSEEIKKIYLGLPEHFKNVVFWVGRKFRTNILSHQPGGGDIIVEYHNGKILGYDWIKFPSRYVQTIFRKQFFKNEIEFEQYKEYEQLNVIKKEVARLFARIYKEDEFDIIYFEEIWNSENDEKLPWVKLEEFENEKEKERNEKAKTKEEKTIIEKVEKLDDVSYDEEYGERVFILKIGETKRNLKIASEPKEIYSKIQNKGTTEQREERILKTKYIKLPGPKLTGKIDLEKFNKKKKY